MRTIIEMAREAGFSTHHEMIWIDTWEIGPCMQRFAALVRSDEREACAKLLENQKYMVLEPSRIYTADALARSNKASVMYMAEAIRARGQA